MLIQHRSLIEGSTGISSCYLKLYFFIMLLLLQRLYRTKAIIPIFLSNKVTNPNLHDHSQKPLAYVCSVNATPKSCVIHCKLIETGCPSVLITIEPTLIVCNMHLQSLLTSELGSLWSACIQTSVCQKHFPIVVELVGFQITDPLNAFLYNCSGGGGRGRWAA